MTMTRPTKIDPPGPHTPFDRGRSFANSDPFFERAIGWWDFVGEKRFIEAWLDGFEVSIIVAGADFARLPFVSRQDRQHVRRKQWVIRWARRMTWASRCSACGASKAEAIKHAGECIEGKSLRVRSECRSGWHVERMVHAGPIR